MSDYSGQHNFMSRSGPDGLHVPEKETTVSNILQIIRYTTSFKNMFLKHRSIHCVFWSLPRLSATLLTFFYSPFASISKFSCSGLPADSPISSPQIL